MQFYKVTTRLRVLKAFLIIWKDLTNGLRNRPFRVSITNCVNCTCLYQIDHFAKTVQQKRSSISLKIYFSLLFLPVGYNLRDCILVTRGCKFMDMHVELCENIISEVYIFDKLLYKMMEDLLLRMSVEIETIWSGKRFGEESGFCPPLHFDSNSILPLF